VARQTCTNPTGLSVSAAHPSEKKAGATEFAVPPLDAVGSRKSSFIGAPVDEREMVLM